MANTFKLLLLWEMSFKIIGQRLFKSIDQYFWSIIFNIIWFISSISECYSQIVGKKYWKISLVVKVISCENIEFITRGLKWNSIFSLVITSTTRDIFQYFLPAIWESFIELSNIKINHCNGITTCAPLPFSKVIFEMCHEMAPARSSNILSSQHRFISDD